MRGFGNDIEIVPLDRYNWEKVIPLEVEDSQKDFLHSNLYLLAHCRFENLTPYGILNKGEMAGMITFGEFNGICWINHIMIDRKFQQQGVGGRALQVMIDFLRSRRHCHEIRTTVSRKNLWGLYFFEQAGFETIEDDLGGEVVLRFAKKRELNF